MTSLDQFETFMADLKTRSKAKRAALAAWWMIENVNSDDPSCSAVYWAVRLYMAEVQR